MTALPKQKTYYSPAEYLTLERAAEFRSEYFNGQIFAMAGESLNHGRIKADVVMALGNQLRGKSCETFTSDTKVRTPGINMFGYPDVLVVCGALIHHDQFQDVLLNPKVNVSSM